MKSKTSKNPVPILIPAYIAALAGEEPVEKIVRRRIAHVEVNDDTISGKIFYHGVQMIVSKDKKGEGRRWRATAVSSIKIVRKSNSVKKRRRL